MNPEEEARNKTFQHVTLICRGLSVLCTVSFFLIIFWDLFVVSVMSVSIINNDSGDGFSPFSFLLPIVYLLYGINASLIPLILGRMIRGLFTQRTPFTLENARRLSVLSLILFAYSILGTLLGYADSRFNKSIQNDYVAIGDLARDFASNIATTLDVFPLIMAAIFFALSYVFKYGVLLQQESDETL